jgi:ferric-dicitrate binding protein FerR (iron transport regulator)
MDWQRFQLLLDDYLNGSASVAEVAELEHLLHQPRMRRALVERCLLEVHLHKAFSATGISPIVRQPVRRWLFRGLVAASLLLAACSATLFTLQPKGDSPRPTELATGTVVSAGKVRIDGALVDRLPDDRWFEVGSGVPASLHLVDGSTVELTPGSRARLRGASSKARQVVEMSDGSGRFKVVPGQGAFRVETEIGKVQVLGTEFSVKLELRKSEERREKVRPLMTVSVTEGSVAVEADGKARTLRAGESRTFGREGRREHERDD